MDSGSQTKTADLRAREFEQRFWEEGVWFADIQSAGEKRTDGAAVQDGVTGAAGIAAAARSVYEGVYADAEEAEFRAAESGSRAADQRD
jgi:hypothetical protein